MSAESSFEEQVSGIAALKDPGRRALYQYVVERAEPVGRDEAARELGMSRALAAFHLDKLVEQDLLESTFRRLSGRTGPGAGRPSKLYQRSHKEHAVSLPPRGYELAARLFARALDGNPEAQPQVDEVAEEFGRELAAAVAADRSGKTGAGSIEAILRRFGYEPFRDTDGTIRLRNCPFHALVFEHRELVCTMNLSLLRGVVDQTASAGIEAVLDPRPDTCCVAFRFRGAQKD
jgi:predicted ArsR family transcriptional regulator